MNNTINSNAMENLFIEPTPVTPYVLFNSEKGILDIKGRSSPDNSLEFYSRILKYIDEYFSNPAEQLQINVNLEYFNTSSLKCIFQMLKRLSDASEGGTAVEVNWYYEEEDEDMLETGEDIADLLDLDFNFISDESEVTQPALNKY